MTTKGIFAVGRITGGNIEICAAPTREARALEAARWFGALDAAKGEPCLPGKYFITPELVDAYIAGYHS